MSWAEVKKFLNKRSDKSLDEIMDEKEQNASGAMATTGTKGFTTSGTICSITGKGRLYYFHIAANVAHGSNVLINLKVDGKTILSVKGTGSDNYLQLRIISVNHHTPKTRDGYYIGLRGNTHTTFDIEGFMNLGNNEINSSYLESYGILLPEYIRFNESVEITATLSGSWYNATTDNGVGIGYKLD